MYFTEAHMTNQTLSYAKHVYGKSYELHALIDTVKRVLVVFPHDRSHIETAARYLGVHEEELKGRAEHLVGALVFFNGDVADRGFETKWTVEAFLGMSSIQTRQHVKNPPATLKEAERILRYYLEHAKLPYAKIEKIAKIDIVDQKNI